MRRTVPCLLAFCGLAAGLALVSCASPLADYSGYVAPRPYDVGCNEGWQHAGTALKVNGFTIVSVQRGASGGVIEGKRGDESMSIAVSCETDGVHVTPSGLTPFARNGMLIAFQRVIETARRQRPPAGLEASAELISGVEGTLYFASGLSSTVALRVRVANGGSRPVKLLVEDVRLRTPSGGSAAAIARDDVQRRFPALAAEVQPHLLGSTVLRSGDRAEGFLLFPEGRYASATLQLIDVETAEPEEFDFALGEEHPEAQ